jgi:hypothetical protein
MVSSHSQKFSNQCHISQLSFTWMWHLNVGMGGGPWNPFEASFSQSEAWKCLNKSLCVHKVWGSCTWTGLYSRERENWHMNDPPPRLGYMNVSSSIVWTPRYQNQQKMNRVSREGLKVRALLEVEPRGWTHFITIPAFNTKTITKRE